MGASRSSSFFLDFPPRAANPLRAGRDAGLAPRTVPFPPALATPRVDVLDDEAEAGSAPPPRMLATFTTRLFAEAVFAEAACLAPAVPFAVRVEVADFAAPDFDEAAAFADVAVLPFAAGAPARRELAVRAAVAERAVPDPLAIPARLPAGAATLRDVRLRAAVVAPPRVNERAVAGVAARGALVTLLALVVTVRAAAALRAAVAAEATGRAAPDAHSTRPPARHVPGRKYRS